MTTRNHSVFAKLLFAAILLALFFMPAVGSRDALLAAQKSKKDDKPYALIFGTVWGPDDRPVYGVTVHIRLSTDKPRKVRWEVVSDHHGEFAQRVPSGEADYILTADLEHAKFSDGKTLRLPKDVTLHIYNDEREDTGLHLTH
ncbi:MAG: hypothetical protein ACRD3B_03875 [Candidatus Sulfotelmatobacter sp.]